ncbi:Ribonuclease 3 [Acorus gramineus]|uniref:Ribonuclease 3 n=1 Tax=Acorus gramineus TaxID=55184 RepID=A0AAV9AN86_ACOGR|nr:Ribonuclease 3 [Acorus gramineus]
MASHVALTAVMVVMMLASSQTINAAEIGEFDFYYLVLMWPGAYCEQSKGKCCMPKTGKPEIDFFVRGLWTADATTGSQVTKCNQTSFYVNQLDGLSSELAKYWSNIRCPSNNGVSNWKSTWKTYGICSGLDEPTYFDTVLNMRSKIELLSLLVGQGYGPSNTAYYRTSDIEAAISSVIGARPVIRCSKDQSGEFQLYEVYVCVNKEATEVIECPSPPAFTCSDFIRFHPFTYDMLKVKLAMPASG